MSELQRRCGHGGDRPLHAFTHAAWRGRPALPRAVTWLCSLHVDQTQQPVLYPCPRCCWHLLVIESYIHNNNNNKEIWHESHKWNTQQNLIHNITSFECNKPLMCKILLDLICTVVATTNKNSNASLVYSFLYKLVEVSHTYRCNL